MNPDDPKFNPGAVLDRVDNRDYKWSEVGFSAAPFDWNVGYDVEEILRVKLSNPNFKIGTKDQNGSGSCGGQAWAYLGAILEAVYTGTYEERSAKFIYSQTYVPPAGSNGRENCIVVIKQGWAREAVLSSYQNGMPPGEAFMQRSQDITDVVRQDAAKAKGLAYVQIDNPDVDTIAQAMRENHGVIIGIVGSNNGSWNSAWPNPPKMSENRWYHWIYIGKAKMIGGKKFFCALNSWGTAVGDQGWQWISEDYVKTLLPGDNHGGRAIWSGWTLTYNDVVVPPTWSHNFQTNLALNQSGDEVTALQKALQIDGEFPANLAPTKFYGDITRRAVLAFQLKYKVDTVAELNKLAGKNVGPKTRTQLNILFNK